MYSVNPLRVSGVLLRKQSWLLALILVFFCSCISKKVNHLDSKGQRHGVWVSYYDTENKLLWSKTKFRHGKPVGDHYYYFAQSGMVDRHEKYGRGSRLKVWLYHSNGKLRMHGKARQVEDEKQIHFYFEGRWKVYDENGELIRIQQYKEGKIEKTERIKYKKDDSLKLYLEMLDKRFQEADKVLTDSINLSVGDERKNYYRKLKKQVDSLTFAEALNFIVYTGYPSKQEVGEAAVIPFYLLSFAPVNIREAALPIFEQAAEKGDVSYKSLAFFIDKLRIAKQQKQLYGTQFRIEDGKSIYYPSEDPEHLNERRLKVGLEEVK